MKYYQFKRYDGSIIPVNVKVFYGLKKIEGIKTTLVSSMDGVLIYQAEYFNRYQ